MSPRWLVSLVVVTLVLGAVLGAKDADEQAERDRKQAEREAKRKAIKAENQRLKDELKALMEAGESSAGASSKELEAVKKALAAAEAAEAAANATAEEAKAEAAANAAAAAAARAEAEAAAKAAAQAAAAATSGKCDELPTSVAHHKKARQSSNLDGRSVAGLAVDNIRIPDHAKGPGCAITNAHPQGAWWQVDLEGDYGVTSVLVTNRGDKDTDRTRDFDIRVYAEDPALNPAASSVLCEHHAGPMPTRANIRFQCRDAPARGRFVRITNAPNQILQLCEVKVFGLSAAQLAQCDATKLPTNVAVGKPARQSTRFIFNPHGSSAANLAVDNNLNPYYWLPGHSCSNTAAIFNPASGAWWQVDLQADYDVHYVNIAARADPKTEGELRDFTINVYARDPATQSGTSNPPKLCARQNNRQYPWTVKTHVCQNGPVRGRFVRITGPQHVHFSLCEVEVFAVRAQ